MGQIDIEITGIKIRRPLVDLKQIIRQHFLKIIWLATNVHLTDQMPVKIRFVIRFVSYLSHRLALFLR